MNRVVTAAGVGLAVAVAAGCGASNAGVAARVGDRAVVTSRLAGLVDRSLSHEEFRSTVGDNADAYVRAKLTSLVRVALLEEAARRLGVAVTAADVERRIARFVESLGGRENFEEQAKRQGVAPADLPEAVRELVLTEAVGLKLVEGETVAESRLRKAYQDNVGEFDRARPAHILLDEDAAALARRLARQARAGADFAALAREHSRDEQSRQAGGDLGFQARGRLDPAFERVLYATPVGGVGGPVRTRVGWHVVKVLDRRHTPFARAREELRARILAPRAEEAREALLTRLAGELGVRVNPRFGRWDPQTSSVLPSADEVASPVPSPSPLDDGRGVQLGPGGPPGPPGPAGPTGRPGSGQGGSPPAPRAPATASP